MAIFLAALFQQADAQSTQHWIVIFIGILTVSILLMAIVGSVVLLSALKAIKTFTNLASEFGEKAGPLLHELGAVSRETREVLEDAKPKIKTITEHMAKASTALSETAEVARSAVQKVDATIADANTRTQRQVARVDGMVSAALNTTVEVVEAVNHGIRVPAQKVAQAAGQAKLVAEALLDRIKGMAGAVPFMGQKRSGRSASAASSYRSSASESGTAASETAGRTYAAAPRES